MRANVIIQPIFDDNIERYNRNMRSLSCLYNMSFLYLFFKQCEIDNANRMCIALEIDDVF